MTRDEQILSLDKQVRGAARYWAHRTPADFDDLYSVGMLGAIKAVDHFDGARGLQLTTYADWRIRGQILDYLRFSHLLAGLSNKNWDEVKVLRFKPSKAKATDMIADQIPDPRPTPEVIAIESERSARLRAAIGRLRWNDRMVMQNELAGGEAWRAAKQLAVDVSRVSHLRKRALATLRRELAA